MWPHSLSLQLPETPAAWANVAVTVGLLVFAGMQWWVIHSAEATRRREREKDQERQAEAAFQLVWAEHFRLEGLADYFDKVDLIELAVLGVLQPGEVLPRDWAVVTEMLGRLSVEAGYLGGVAVSISHDTARQIAILNGAVSAFAAEWNVPAPQKVEYVRKHHGKELETHERAIRTGVRELSRLLWDAIRHSPIAGKKRRLEFRDDLESALGRAAVEALAKRGEAVVLPPPPSGKKP